MGSSSFRKRAKGITLVSLIVTIIVLLVLAGVTLNLVNGPNGILGKAAEAVDINDIAKMKEAVELAQGEALLEINQPGVKGTPTVYEYIKKKVEEEGEYKVGSGKFTIEDGVLIYTDDKTGNSAKVTPDSNGGLVVKEVTIENKTTDLTTEKSLTEEIEVALLVYLKEYQKGAEGTFQEYLGKLIRETEKGYFELENGSKIYVNEDGTLVYTDASGNTTTFIVTDQGKVALKEMEQANGTIVNMTTETSFELEFKKAIEDENSKYEKYLIEKGLDMTVYTFEDYLCDKADNVIAKEIVNIYKVAETAGKGLTKTKIGTFEVTTGGKITAYEDRDSEGNHLFEYTDAANSPSVITFVAKEVENKIKVIKLGEYRAVTIIAIEMGEDTGGNTKPSEEEKEIPAKDLKKGDIEFEYEPESNVWTNKTVKVTAIPKLTAEELEGYTLQTSMNGKTWSDNNYQVFEKNGTMYVRLTTGKKVGAVATTTVTKIEKNEPQFTITDYTAKTISTTLDDIVEKENSTSGIWGYRITTTNDGRVEGKENYTKFETKQDRLNYKFENLNVNTTYYMTVIDEAGNVSELIENRTLTEAEQLEKSRAIVDNNIKGEANYSAYGNIYDYLINITTGEYEVREQGRYYKDGEKIYYADYETDAVSYLIVDKDKNLISKEITKVDGSVQKLVTTEVIEKEIEAAVNKVFEEYQEAVKNGTIGDKTFEEYLKERIKNGTIENLPNGGRFEYDEETNKMIYIDAERNKTTFVTAESKDEEGNKKITIIVKERIDGETGEITDLSTEDTLEREVKKVIEDLKKEYEKEGITEKKFREWLDEKADEKGIIPTSTGGKLTTNGDGSYVYEDTTNSANTVEFTIDKNGNITIGKITVNPSINDEKKPDDVEEPKRTIDLREGDIQITTSETKWTNKEVTVTARINPREGLDIEGYIIRTSKRPTSGYINTETQTYTINGDFYVQLYNQKTGDKVQATASKKISNIDTKKPEIEDEGKSTSRVVKFVGTDEKSGIVDVIVKNKPNQPSEEEFGGIDGTGELKYEGEVRVEKGGIPYYIWAIDDAGNISEMLTITVPTDSGTVADKIQVVKYQDIEASPEGKLEVEKIGIFEMQSNGTVKFTDEDTGAKALIVADREGNLIVKNVTVNGRTIEMTKSNLDGVRGEIEAVISKVLKDYDKNEREETAEEYIKEQINNSRITDVQGNKCIETTFGGQIIIDKSTGLLEYTDVLGNKITFRTTDEGDVSVQEILLAGERKRIDGTTETSLKNEAQKALDDLYKEYQKEQKQPGAEEKTFKEWLKGKAEENGGKIETTTGGVIIVNDNGTLTYQNNKEDEKGINSNKIEIIIDDYGKIIEIVETEYEKEIEEKPTAEPVEMPILKEGDIKFTIIPENSQLTNQKVKIRAEYPAGSELVGKGLWIQMNKAESTLGWSNRTEMTTTANGKIYARITDGHTASNSIYIEVNNIDKEKPEINGISATSYSVVIDAIDNRTEKANLKYIVKESIEEPKQEDFISTNDTITGLKNGTTYYIWVKDEAGNISDKYEQQVEEITKIENTNVSYELWENETKIEAGKYASEKVKVKVNITGVTYEGYKISLSKDGENWIEATEIELTENGPVYITLADESGQQGNKLSIDVQIIDKLKPVIEITKQTAYTISFKWTDDLSGVNKYAIKTEESEPSEFNEIAELEKNEGIYKIKSLAAGTKYYIWLKDKAERISEMKAVSLKTVVEYVVESQEESQEEIRAQIVKDGLDLEQTSVKEYVKEKINENRDNPKRYETSIGMYTLDDEGNLIYTDKETGATALLVADKDGNLIVKTVTEIDDEGNEKTTDITISSTLTEEIKAAINEVNKATGKTIFEEMKEEAKTTGNVVEGETENGTVKYDPSTNKWIYVDKSGNTTTFIPSKDGQKVSVKETIDKNGNKTDNTTAESLKIEVDIALEELKEKYEAEKAAGTTDKTFLEWLEEKTKNGNSITLRSTGGKIVSNEDGTFTYEDNTDNKNKAEIKITEDGKAEILSVEINNKADTIEKDPSTTVLQESDIIIKYAINEEIVDELPEHTNENITVKAVLREAIQNEDIKIQTKRNKADIWNNRDTQVFTTNGTFYVQVINEGSQAAATTAITIIDKDEPETTVTDVTTEGFKITATDDASGVDKYYINHNDEVIEEAEYIAPGVTIDNLTSGGKYNVYVTDKAGNKSEEKEVKIITIIEEEAKRAKEAIKEVINKIVETKSLEQIKTEAESTGEKVTVETELGNISYDPISNKWTYEDKEGNSIIEFIPILDETTGEVIDIIVKEKTDKVTGEVTDLTTEESLKQEADLAMKELKNRYKEEKTEGQTFFEWLEAEAGTEGKIEIKVTGGIITVNTDGTLTYQDRTEPANTIDIIISQTEAGEIESKTEKPEINQPEDISGELPELKTLKKSDIKFVINPEGWTNGRVKVKISSTSEALLETGLKLQTSKNNVIWKHATEQSFLDNGTLYVRLWNGKEGSNSVSTKIENIEKDLPKITEISNITTYGFSIKGTDETSGVQGYYLTKEYDEVPTDLKKFSNFASTAKSVSKNIEVLDQGKTYYVWLRDVAGNISKEATRVVLRDMDSFGNLENPNVKFNVDKTEWLDGIVTVNVEFTESSEYNTGAFKLETTKMPNNESTWKEETTVQFEENATLYVRIKDERGQVSATKAAISITNIDKTNPKIQIDDVSSYGVEFTTRDDESGLLEYKVTETEEEPTEEWLGFVGEKATDIKNVHYEDHLAPGTDYYIWIKDIVGHVIHQKITTYEVPVLTNENVTFEYISKNGEIIPETDRWNAAPVTIKATLNSIPREAGDISNYKIWGSKSNDTSTWFEGTGNTISVTYNETIDEGKLYVGLRDAYLETKNFSKTVLPSKTVVGIDDVAPTVDEVESLTSYSFKIKATDGYSGLAGYFLTDTNEAPTLGEEGWTEWNYEAGTETITIENRENLVGKTKYVWVKDRAGNISETSKELEMLEVPDIETTDDFNLKITPDGETNITPITFEFSIKDTVDNYRKNNYTFAIYKDESITKIAKEDIITTTTLPGNGSIYLVLVDKNGEISTNPYEYKYKNYDNTAPSIVVTEASTTTRSITYNITDTHTIAKYALKQEEYVEGTTTVPEEEDSAWKPVEASSTGNIVETELTNNKPYIIWAVDKAGNISHKETSTKQFNQITTTTTWDVDAPTGTIKVDGSETNNVYYLYDNISSKTAAEASALTIADLTQYTAAGVPVNSGSTTYFFRWDGRNLSNYKSVAATMTYSIQIKYETPGVNNTTVQSEWNKIENIPNPSRTGYSFTGWAITGYSASSAYTGTTAETVNTLVSGAGNPTSTYFKNLINYNGGTVTLTATWFQVTYTVKLNTNSGTINSGNVTSYTYGTGATLPTSANITRTGYTFNGWFDNSGLTGTAITSISATSTGNKEYWAKWTINNYYLDLNGVLDGTSKGDISGYGTANVYINGSLKSSGVTDYYQQHPYGTTYKIDVTATTGHSVSGNSSFSGTIGAR